MHLYSQLMPLGIMPASPFSIQRNRAAVFPARRRQQSRAKFTVAHTNSGGFDVRKIAGKKVDFFQKISTLLPFLKALFFSASKTLRVSCDPVDLKKLIYLRVSVSFCLLI